METFNQRAPDYCGKSYKIAGNTLEETKWRSPSPKGEENQYYKTVNSPPSSRFNAVPMTTPKPKRLFRECENFQNPL